MRARLALLPLAALALLAFASTAAAEKPVRFPLPAGPFDLPADICGFVVHEDVLANNEYGKIFANGTFAINGTFKLRLTNPDKPTNTLDVNISGPGALIPNPDGTTSLRAEGRSLFFFFPGQLGPGSPGALILTTGLVTELFDETGNVVPGSFSHTGGTETDVCAALA
jgi:hypothetical protein